MDIVLIQRLVWHMSSVVMNSLRNYWLSGADSDHALKECYHILDAVMEDQDSLEFKTLADNLKVNDHSVLLKDNIMKAFVSHLEQYSIQNFEFHKGITIEQFAAVIAIIISRDDNLREPGGFSAMLERYEIDNVTSRNVIYREISDEEVVLQKEQLLKQQLELEETIRSYLSGNEPGDEEFYSGLAAISSDSHKMAGLVLDAASMGLPSGAGVSPDQVVECLNRAFEGLMNDASFASPTGKRKLGRALKNLEAELTAMLGSGEGSFAPGCSDAVKDAMYAAKSDVKVQALAAEYMKKRKAIEQSEKRLLRFIKSVGLDKINDSTLEERLGDEGLDIEGWRALLGKSVIQSDGMLDGALERMNSIDSVGSLAQLLAKLDDGEADGGSESPTMLADGISDVRQEINQKTVHTKIKINSLAREIGADEEVIQRIEKFADNEAHSLRLSRKKLISVIAEIVQELCQPLVVIQATNDMLVSGKLGTVSGDQRSMVELSKQSGDRMQYLINELVKIAGTPDHLNPDLIGMGIVPSEGSADRDLLSKEDAEAHKEIP
jgi:hypothetical protein